MPVHLVSFTVCDCKEFIVNYKNAGAVTRIWTTTKTNDIVEKSFSFAEESLRRIMVFFEEWFNIKFPLPKIDFVVLPILTENIVNGWGLVLLR